MSNAINTTVTELAHSGASPLLKVIPGEYGASVPKIVLNATFDWKKK